MSGAPPRALFCENESNAPRLWGAPRTTPWPKDGINDHVVAGHDTVNPALVGTKAALWYRLDLGARAVEEVVVRLTAVLDARRAEADDYPPVHAWAALRVFEIDGGTDFDFLEKVLHKLLLNFTWWVNRKDVQGNNIFEGGFLGMDNIGPIDRSKALPPGHLLEQSDGTAWMAMYCLDLWEMCLLLAAGHDRVYDDLAIKFLEHFASIARALRASALWNEEDGFYYDILTGDGEITQLRVQSMVGLLPLFAVRIADVGSLQRAEVFREHLRWFLEHQPDAGHLIAADATARAPEGRDGAHLLSIVSLRKLPLVLARVFDEEQFLAPTGVRSLSKAHDGRPYVLELAGWRASVGYEPAESRSGLFGGNSNWRGPVWFPVNHLLVESLRRYADWTDGSLLVEVPTGSGRKVPLAEAADELATRLVSTFLPGPDGVRPFARPDWSRMPAAWRDRLTFHEFFHGDTGAGLGASHQSGWTALVVDLIATLAARRANSL